jgi:hypothetical protein
MSQREFHVMNTELIEDRQTMRYTCPVCQRCLEDGPEGITLIHKGDQSASHSGGSLGPAHCEVEQARPAQPVLH